MDIVQNYKNIIEQCEQLDYSDFEHINNYVWKDVYHHSQELSIIIMINILLKSDIPNSDIFVENLNELVYHSGNQFIFDYIKNKINEYIKSNHYNYYTEYDLEENLSILRHKYGKLGYFLE